MKYSFDDKNGKIEPYVMMAPFLVLFIFFTVIPIISSILLSFSYFDMIQMPQFVGIKNYSRMFLEDDIFIKALSNTLVFAIITGPISYLMCFSLAWLINDLDPRVRAVMTFLFYSPTISGSLYVIWTYIFSGDSYGFLNGTMMKYGIFEEPIQWLTDPGYTLSIVMLVQIWLSLGASFLSFIAGLQNVDKALYEAGAIDGIRNRWQELFYITLPSMGPQLQFGAVIQIGASFSVGAVAIALIGYPSTDYSAETIVTHIMDVGNLRFEMGYASAISVFLFALLLVTNYVLRGLLKKISKD